MSNEHVIYTKITELQKKLMSQDFVIDKTGVQMVELEFVTVKHLDPRQKRLVFSNRETNDEYVKKELAWYESENRNIKGYVDDVKLWCSTADKDGVANSNYGWCVFSKENGSQLDFAVAQLDEQDSTRRALMMYNRPSMTTEWNENGRNDYMCTIYTELMIRSGRLHYHVHQRSCDLIYGLFNDLAWHQHVYEIALAHVNSRRAISKVPLVKPGDLHFIFDSLHVYSRHFDVLRDMELVQEGHK